jgi:hypothetical protein
MAADETRTSLTEFSLLDELSLNEPNIPVVIGDPLFYIEAAKYAPAALRPRLVYVANPDLATRLIGSDTGDKENRILAEFIPLHVEDLAPFEAAHQRFILYSDSFVDWLTPYLVKSGYRLSLLSTDVNSQRRPTLTEVDSQIYIAER